MESIKLKRLKAVTKNIKREINVYRLVLKDPRTPWLARIFLGSAIGYLMLPFDLIPDFIPVLGMLDDVVIIPLLVWLAMKKIPDEVVRDCRSQVMVQESGQH